MVVRGWALPPVRDGMLAHLIRVYELPGAATNEQKSLLPLPIGEPPDSGDLRVQLSRPDDTSR